MAIPIIIVKMGYLEEAVTNAVKTANRTGKACGIRRSKSEFMNKYGPYDPSPTVLIIEPGMTDDEALNLVKEQGWK